MRKSIFALFLSVVLIPDFLLAKGPGTSSGLTLIEAAGARAAALGEAFTGMADELSAMSYNPASLGTLESGQASFMYQKGLVEDAFGQFQLGAPTKKGGWGLTVGYYNGGTMDISYDGVTSETVNAQKDLMIGLGYGWKIGKASLGINAKYLSSQLIEKEKATAYAGDVGLSFPINSRLRVGTALQNFGTQLKYVEEGDSLPRIARAGASLAILKGRTPLTLLMDAPYFMNEQELRPAVGLELGIGALALRTGYRKLGDENEFSVGTGFLLGRTSFDYAFGMMQNFDSQQRVSLSMKFGGESQVQDFAKKKEEKKEKVAEASESRKTIGSLRKPVVPQGLTSYSQTQRENLPKKAPRVYLIKPGDSLTKISSKYYGRSDMWQAIYNANRHLIDDPRSLEPGQKILIP